MENIFLFPMEKCVTSACHLLKQEVIPSCREPTLLPGFHDLLPKLWSHRLRGSNIRKAKAQAVLAAVTGNSSGSVLQLKRGQNQLYGGSCLPSSPPHSPVLFKHSNRDILTVQRKMRRKEQRLSSVLWRRSDFWF